MAEFPDGRLDRGARTPRVEEGHAPLRTVEGTIARVVYTHGDGSFAVVRVNAPGFELPVTAVGPLVGMAPGELVQLEGRFEKHDKFGEQLRVERALLQVPKTGAGVERYLAGLKGIGPESAKRLVASFGTKAIEVLSDEPWRAAKVKGVGKKRAVAASDEAKSRRADREVMVFLQGQGITAAYAARIRKRWGDEAVAKVRENPYRLAREVSGIGFLVADRIARGMGIEASSPLRLEAALYHTLEALSDEGHCYAPAQLLRQRTAEMLDVEPSRFDDALASLIAQRAVLREEGDLIWLPTLYLAEVELARRLRLLSRSPRILPAPKTGGRAEAEMSRLSPSQRKAVEAVRSAGVAVITGGPGTGKTTVMKATVALWEEAKARVVLAAPTGRAAKRLSEATGRSAQTVHRLLEWGRGATWGRNEKLPLEADLVVVDEASMLDLQLARALAAAVPVGATLLLVGDVDQLPSVGPGQVLADVIGAGTLPVARLTEIFRQAAGSRIVEIAHGVRQGIEPSLAGEEAGARRRRETDGGTEPRRPAAGEDFFIIPVEDPLAARDRVLRLCRDRIPAAFGFHPTRDIQVLTPMHRGEAGTEALNRTLQDALNPTGAALSRGNRSSLRVGDKVLQVRNDYDREVWNGDIGEVLSVDPEGPAAEVLFDERRVQYDREALDQLELAYAVSIHKSQGSEYPAVVITLLPEHYMLLRRNLLYTAITRGKSLVVLVGSPRAIRRAVNTFDTDTRFTRLRERLRDTDEAAPDPQRQKGL